jgi:hypothetical protein
MMMTTTTIIIIISQLFNIHWVDDDTQREIHRARQQVPEPSAFEVEMAIEKLKKTHITRC